jgi:hypothetical protein
MEKIEPILLSDKQIDALNEVLKVCDILSKIHRFAPDDVIAKQAKELAYKYEQLERMKV